MIGQLKNILQGFNISTEYFRFLARFPFFSQLFLYPTAEAAGTGCDMGLPVPVRFALQWNDVFTRLRTLRGEMDALEADAEALVSAEKGDWLTAAQFARLSGLSAKTVSNYCGNGHLLRVKKKPNGKWLVHSSELEKY